MRPNFRDGRHFPYWRASNAMIDDGHIKNMGASAWVIYCVLARHANNSDKDQAFPSFNYLQEVTGFSRATISKAIEKLIKLKYLTRIHKGTAKGDRSIYELNDENQCIFETSSKIEPVQKLNLSGSKIEPEVVQKLNLSGSIFEPYKEIEERTNEKEPLKTSPYIPQKFSEGGKRDFQTNLETSEPIPTPVNGSAPSLKNVPPPPVHPVARMEARFNQEQHPWTGNDEFAEWVGNQLPKGDMNPRLKGRRRISNCEQSGDLRALNDYWTTYQSDRLTHLTKAGESDWRNHPQFEQLLHEYQTQNATWFTHPGGKRDETRCKFFDWVQHNLEVST